MASDTSLQTILSHLAAAHQNPQNAMARRSQIPFATTTSNPPPPYHGHQQQQHHAQNTFFTPAFDVLETAHEYILEGELPGLHDKKQTVVEFTDARTVLIRGRIERGGGGGGGEGERNNVRDEGGEDKVWVAERRVGEFRRDFTFPGSIDIEAVRATLEYGILRIVVPKAVEVGPRKIQIQ